MVNSRCRKVVLGIDDIFVIIGGVLEIVSGLFKWHQCYQNYDKYAACRRYALAGIGFAALALFLAILSLAFECGCPKDGKDTPDELFADDKAKHGIKTKDILKILKTSFTAIALGLLLGAACSKDVCEV